MELVMVEELGVRVSWHRVREQTLGELREVGGGVQTSFRRHLMAVGRNSVYEG